MFKEFLKEKRERAGISRYRLGMITGISPQQIANYESGMSEPTIRKANALCRALDAVYVLGRGWHDDDGQ